MGKSLKWERFRRLQDSHLTDSYCTDFFLQNCEHNTFGDSCDYCMPGFHGDARGGHASDCKKCACPLVDNSFSETCRPVPDGRGYVCDACKPGYTGMYCERLRKNTLDRKHSDKCALIAVASMATLAIRISLAVRAASATATHTAR